MKAKSANDEIKMLAPFLSRMPRSEKQTHGLNESDCEVLKLSAKLYWATSIDSVSEEWVYQLYRNPETLAWLCVQGALSDLVACGVKAEGFLFSPLWPMANSAPSLLSLKKKIFKTVEHSLRLAGVPLLGGDQGESASLSLTGVAMGSATQKPISRIGIKPGDYLCTLGEMGNGPALGFRYLLGLPEKEFPEELYRPIAALNASESILKFANAAIDTSDGFCSALHQLSVLNDVRFELEPSRVKLSKKAAEFCRRNAIPELALWFGEHGDYQTLFAISPVKLKHFQKKFPQLQVIGHALAQKETSHRLRIGPKILPFFPGLLAHEAKNDLKSLKRAFSLMLGAIQKMGIWDVIQRE